MKPLIILLLSILPVSYGSSVEIMMVSLMELPPLIQEASYDSLRSSDTSSHSVTMPLDAHPRLPPFYTTERHNSGLILYVFAIPSSPVNGLDGVFYDPSRNQSYLRVKVMTPAKKGNANTAIIRLIAQILKIEKSQLHIIDGEMDHCKKISISSVSENELERLLSATKKGSL
jgi:uncharacterized protein YggU (UPF0235/DUF167 family)